MDLSGEIDGRFRITGKLGAGGMGEVYRARDERLRRDVALKVLPETLARDSGRLSRFEHEARAAAALNHPNILSLYDLGYHDGAPYLVTELLAGQSLRDRIEAGPLPVKVAVGLAVQLARGLSAAHAKGIVHRDLKPENVFVTTDGTVKILDFGLASLRWAADEGGDLHEARTETELTQTGTVLGTVGYMAPEQVRGLKVDQRADIFSYGCVLYEMLAGRRAFARDTAADTMSAILESDPMPVEVARTEVSPALAQLLRRCLEKRPEDRFSSARDLALALQASVSDTSVTVGGVSAVPPRRLRRPWAAGLAAVLVVIVALAVVWMRGGSPAPGPETALDPAKVVVLPFDNLTGEPSLDPIATLTADSVAQGLVELGDVEVVPVPGGSSGGDEAEMLEAARSAGAGTLVTGNYYLTGGTLDLRGRVEDVASGQPLFALKPERGPRERPDEAIDRVRQRTMSALLMHLGRAPGLGGITTPPLFSAYQEFMTASSLMGVDAKGVLAHLERATAIDPEFWHPQIRLTSWYRRLGLEDEADAALARLQGNQDKLGPADKIFLQFYDAALGGRTLEAYRKARELLAMGPRDFSYHFGAATLALDLGRPREALECVGDVHTFDWKVLGTWMQGSWLLRIAAVAHHLLGQYEAELEVADFGARLYPDMLNLRQRRVSALAALGRIDQLAQTITDSLAIQSRTESPGDVMLTAAEELRAHGHPEDARRIAAQGAAWYAALAEDQAARPAVAVNRIELLWLAGQLDEARRVADAALAKGSTHLYLTGYRGIVAARSGDLATARSVERELATAGGDTLWRGDVFWLRACIAAQLGDRDEAVALLREALAQGFRDPQSLHVYAFLEPLHGYPAFEELIAPKG
jgi:TolB-like protein